MSRNTGIVATLALAVVASLAAAGEKDTAPAWAKKDIRAGMIGCDTSHCVAFAGVFARHPAWRIRVVAAVPQASEDMPGPSVKRLPKFTAKLRETHGVAMVDSIADLLKRVDAVMIESVDGRPHLRQARPCLAAGLPVFIDKPLTASLADAREIVRLSKKHGTPFFSSSCVRFQPEVAKLRADPGVGKLLKAQGSSPMHIEPHHPDLFWYGIHGVEALYTVMGRGCVSVSRAKGEKLDVTTGTWKDGRTGIFRGVRSGSYKPVVRVWGTDGEAQTTGGYNYHGLCEAIARFFHTKKVPVDPAETLEIIEFMTAAQLSGDRGGAAVTLEEVRRKAG